MGQKSIMIPSVHARDPQVHKYTQNTPGNRTVQTQHVTNFIGLGMFTGWLKNMDMLNCNRSEPLPY